MVLDNILMIGKNNTKHYSFLFDTYPQLEFE